MTAAAAAAAKDRQKEARAIRAVEPELATQDALVALSAERERTESAVLQARVAELEAECGQRRAAEQRAVELAALQSQAVVKQERRNSG